MATTATARVADVRGARSRHRQPCPGAVDRRMKRKPLGAVSAAMLVVLVLTAVFADVLAPYDPLAHAARDPAGARPAAPTPSAPTTSAATSSAASSTAAASRCGWGCWRSASGPCFGMIIGLLCGYCEGRLDLIMQRVMDAIQAIPGLVLALAIVSVLKPNTTNAMLAIAIVIIPGNSRIVRGAVLSAKQNRYVEAAQAIGCRHPRHHPQPHPAQRDGADPDHRVDLARQRDPHRGHAVLPRASAPSRPRRRGA